MLSGVGIVCFAASYVVALVLELSRLLFRSAVRGVILFGFAGAGLFAHTVFLYYQAIHAQGAPLSSERDWYLVASWFLVALYLLFAYVRPQTPFGVFMLPLVLVLIGIAAGVADPRPYPREPASRIWGMIHGFSIAMAVGSLLAGVGTGLMYLYQARQLKRKVIPNRTLKLPSLEWLQTANSHSIIVSVLTLGIGVASGVILITIRRSTGGGRLAWDDPFVLTTLGMFGWLLLAVLIGAFYRPIRQGRRVVYLTLVSFVFLIIALTIGLFMNTEHGGKRERDEGKPVSRASVPSSISSVGECG